MAISPQQLALAQYLDQIGAGKSTGGGGASDHSRAMKWAQFVNSNMGRLPYASDAEKKAMFEKIYFGGGTVAPYGKMPNDIEKQQFLDKTFSGIPGGNAQLPGRGQMPAAAIGPGNLGGAGQGGFGGTGGGQFSPEQLSALFMLSAQSDMDARNAANKARENEIRSGMDGLYDRSMGRVTNYGKAEEALMKERASENDRSREARLAFRGLGNSSGNEAFQQRSNRDLALQLQALSERVDDRAMRTDIDLTRDKNNFVERITDSGPELSQMMQMAQQLGLAGGGGLGGIGQRGGQVAGGMPGGYTPQFPQQQSPQMTPWGPIQRASYDGGLSRTPLNAGPQINPFNPLGLQPVGISQSALPQRRSNDHYAALKKAIGAVPWYKSKMIPSVSNARREVYDNYMQNAAIMQRFQ